MAENKVRFGLKNVYYAAITSGTHGTPVHVPGAVSLTLSGEGENETFYADNTKYYISYTNNGYSGSLELARIPEQMLKDIFGMTEGSTSKVLTEKNTGEPVHFALMFQIEGDQDNELYVFYECIASRPEIAGNTTNASKNVGTQSIDITAVPFGTDGKVMARTTADTTTTVRAGWFSTVFVET